MCEDQPFSLYFFIPRLSVEYKVYATLSRNIFFSFLHSAIMIFVRFDQGKEKKSLKFRAIINVRACCLLPLGQQQ